MALPSKAKASNRFKKKKKHKTITIRPIGAHQKAENCTYCFSVSYYTSFFTNPLLLVFLSVNQLMHFSSTFAIIM